MNTPRSKPLVRFGQSTRKWVANPGGHYRQGLYDERMISAIGRVVTTFPVLEQGMIAVLEDLLGGNAPARQVFFSIVNQQTRITVMRSLLENSSVNNEKSGWYDWVLDEYKGISLSRNNYAHGLWWTHDSGKAFISLDENSNAASGYWKEVILNEIETTYSRMLNLLGELRRFEIAQLDAMAAQRASQNTPPSPRAGETQAAHPAPHTSVAEPQPPPQPSDPSPQSDDQA